MWALVIAHLSSAPGLQPVAVQRGTYTTAWLATVHRTAHARGNMFK